MQKLQPATCKENENLLRTTRAAARGLVIAAKFADIGLEVEDSVASHVVVPPLRASYALGRTGPAVRSLGTRACALSRGSYRLVAVVAHRAAWARD